MLAAITSRIAVPETLGVASASSITALPPPAERSRDADCPDSAAPAETTNGPHPEPRAE